MSPSNQNIRETYSNAYHGEILAMLAYADDNNSMFADDNNCMFLHLPETQEEQIGEHLGNQDFSELLKVLGMDGRVLGFVWDGVCHHFIVETKSTCHKGSQCRSSI
jgi:hypothetical protein